MVAVPSAVIFVNNDLVDSVRDMLVRQLHINEAITGAEFDSRLASNPNYIKILKQLNMRLLVERSYLELQNRELADVVMFVKLGEAAILKNRFGPPVETFPVINLTWGKLNIFYPF